LVKLGKVRGGPRRIFGSPLFFTWDYLLFIGGVGESFSGGDLAFGKGNGKGKRRSRSLRDDNQNGNGTSKSEGKSQGKRRSRFPEGMTERKARARERATAKEEADPFGMTTRKGKAKAGA